MFNALRLLGLGRDTPVRVAADDQGRMDAGALAAELARGDGPAIVCAQAGNVNTARSTRSARSSPPAGSTAPGATSTARSACGPPPRPGART